jgi:hypothetical protein
MLEILTPAVTLDLILADSLMTEPWIAPGTTPERITLLVAQASETVTDLWGEPLARQRYQAAVAGYGDTLIELPRRPLIAIDGSPTVTVDDEPLTDFEIDDAAEGLIFRPAGWSRSARLSGRFSLREVPGSDERRIGLTWWAGYRLPGDTEAPAAAPALPAALARACELTVKDWHLLDCRDPEINARAQTFSGGSAEAGGAGAASIAYAANDRRRSVPPEALALIRSARR